MLDVRLGFWSPDPAGQPLSTPQFREALHAGRATIQPLPRRKPDVTKIQRIFAHPETELVLLSNNHPLELMQHWSHRVETVSRPLGQFVQWLTGRAPVYVFSVRSQTPTFERLRRLRLQLAGVVACLTAALLLQLAKRHSEMLR